MSNSDYLNLENRFDGTIPTHRKPKPSKPEPMYIIHYGEDLTEEFTCWLDCTNWMMNQMYVNGGKVEVTLIRTVW